MSRFYVVEQSALYVGGHYFSYTRTVALAAREAKLDVAIVGNKRFAGDWNLPEIDVIPGLTHTWGEAEQLRIREWRSGNIAFDLVKATERHDLDEDDHMLLATLGYAELVALIEYFTRIPVGQPMPVFHLLLRYDPELLRNELGTYRALFEKILRSPKLSRQVRFYSDTEPLSKAFSSITKIPFATLPIPFDQAPLLQALATRSSADRPLTVTYLGDARLEKRFADLPDAISAVLNDPSVIAKVRFVLQANFNVAGGEAGMLQAVQRLRQYPPGVVDLIEEPMSASDYYRTLAEADIVVIPYDPVRYKLRSSGVLVEAMAAGKPIVTSAGSWMAGEVMPDHAVVFDKAEAFGDALRSAINRFAALDEGAKKRAAASLERSTGRFFVDTLLAAGERWKPTLPPAAAPRVLVVIDGDTLVLRNGAGVTAATQFRYLRKAGYLVVGLFIMKKKDLDTPAYERWVEALHDSIAEFDLENAFIVGTGRMSFDLDFQRSSRDLWQHSIAFDLQEAASFDVSLDLLDFLRTKTIDVVWLNYVTNLPIIERLGLRGAKIVGETHDIQSFQKAIYAGKRVNPLDIEEEQKLLARCDHLVSVSKAETAYLSACVDVPVTTTGMFLDAPRDPLKVLAGLKNLGEVVSSCRPRASFLRWDEAWQRNETAELTRISEFGGVDLLFVSSNHLANVSGLHWFFDAIYFPYLASRGVTLLVAGSISEAAKWPAHENVAYVGRVARLDPLYAATKLVIVPITEGAGIAVKTFEALNFGVPVVATPAAVRGTDQPLGGVEVAGTAAGFAAAVVRLLGSRVTRTSLARAAAACARQQFGSDRYAALIDPVMQTLLGARALASPPADRAIGTSEFCEWNDELVCIHRLVRSWIDDQLELSSLFKAADMRRGRAMKILDSCINALVEDGTASLLEDRTGVMSAISRLSDGEGPAMRCVLTDLIDGFARRSATGYGVVVGNAPECWIARVGDGGTARVHDKAYKLAEAATAPTVRQIILPEQDDRQPKLLHITLDPDAGTTGLWCVSQRILLRAVAGPAIGRAGSAYAEVWVESDGKRARLSLPVLYARSAATRWLDFVVGAELPISLTDQSGAAIGPSALVEVGGLLIQRFVLPPNDDRRLTVRVDIEPAAYVGLADMLIFHRVLFGELALASEPAFARAIEGDLEATLARGDFLFTSPSADEMLLHDLVSSATKGTAMSRPNALTILARLVEDPHLSRKEMLRQILENDVHADHFEVETFGYLLGVETEPDPGHHFVASFALDLCLESAIDPGNLDLRPLLDGREMLYAEATMTGTRWREDQEAKDGSRDWHRQVRIAGQGAALPPLFLVVRYTLDGASPGQNQLTFNQVHQAESDGIVSWVWTNHVGTTAMTVPMTLSGPGEIRLAVDNLGLNDPAEDISLEINATVLRHKVDHRQRGAILFAEFAADEHGIAATEIKVSVRKMMTPPVDPRTLGIAISGLELRMSI